LLESEEESLTSLERWQIVAKQKTVGFEKSMKRLEEIVEQLEGESASLEKSLKLFEEGMKLTDACRSILEEAEAKINKFLD
jgi:exodeoxyribonuclease VII small subunit